MMSSSSASQHMDVLSGLLALIRSPDLVAKNIEELQKKISASEDAIRIARQEQAEAKESIVQSAKKDIEIKKKIDDLLAMEASILSTKNQLQIHHENLDVDRLALDKREKLHVENMKALEIRETQLKVAQAALDKRSKDSEFLYGQRKSELDGREQRIATAETALTYRENELRGKVEKLKQLAG